MWIIHKHCNSTSAIDKYWVYKREKDALKMYKELAKGYKDFLDFDLYKELYEDCKDEMSFKEFIKDLLNPSKIDIGLILNLEDDDYIVISELTLEKDGKTFFGRRP